MKKILLASAALALTAPALPAHAQMAVVDKANLLKSIDTARNTLESIRKAEEQIAEAKRMYDSVNGITNIGDVATLLDVPELRGGDLSADGVLDRATEILNGRPELAANVSVGVLGAAMAGQALDNARTRAEGLGLLKNRLDGATTQREINEIQARGTIETAAAVNESNRLASMTAASAAAAKVNRDAERAKWTSGNVEAAAAFGDAMHAASKRGIEAGSDWAITARGE